MKIYTLKLDGATFYTPLLEDAISEIPDEIEEGEKYELSCCDMDEKDYAGLPEWDGF